MDFQEASQIIGISNAKDVEAIRREFARKYNAVEDFSIATSSEKLKVKYNESLQTLELAYRILMQIDKIDDMRDLLSFSKNPVVESAEDDLSNIDPEMALLKFGVVDKMDPERLKSLQEEVVTELTHEMNSFDLEASKIKIKQEINLLKNCYKIALNQLIQNNINELVQSNSSSNKKKLKLWLNVILISLLIVVIFVFARSFLNK